MTTLREAAERIARLGRLPIPRSERRLKTEKAAERIELLVVDAGSRELLQEEWDDFLRRIGVIDG